MTNSVNTLTYKEAKGRYFLCPHTLTIFVVVEGKKDSVDRFKAINLSDAKFPLGSKRGTHILPPTWVEISVALTKLTP